jgi:hypothetical protein
MTNTLKTKRTSVTRALTRAEIDRFNEGGYQVNAVIINRKHDDQRSGSITPIRARRRNTTALTARPRTTVD